MPKRQPVDLAYHVIDQMQQMGRCEDDGIHLVGHTVRIDSCETAATFIFTEQYSPHTLSMGITRRSSWIHLQHTLAPLRSAVSLPFTEAYQRSKVLFP